MKKGNLEIHHSDSARHSHGDSNQSWSDLLHELMTHRGDIVKSLVPSEGARYTCTLGYYAVKLSAS